MNISVIIPATHSYLHAINPCLRRIRAAIFHAKAKRELHCKVYVVTDTEGAMLVPRALVDDVIEMDVKEGGERYKEQAQLLIANLQQVGFSRAIEDGADLCWSVESDVLVPHNALSCSLDMLAFDGGYYGVAFVTYPSQSGGMFLGGRGTPSNPIAEDFLPEEREVPEELKKELDAFKAKAEKIKHPWPEDFAKKQHDLMERVKKCKPKGNVFKANGEQWRPRGWLDNAYPAIGRGAVLPTDWTGLGCTLMSRKALSCAAFDGYDGRGTQDLFLNWRRWYANDVKMCVITHCVCEHVVSGGEEGKRVHVFAHHEPDGEFAGHLRIQHRPFYRFDGTDHYSPDNDGVIKPPA